MLQREYVLYLRKSKGRAGIARQRRETTRHIEQIGGKVVGEFVDVDTTAYAKPGQRAQRDDYLRMLATLRADTRPVPLGVAAWHTDRLNRSTSDADELIDISAEGGHIVETARAGTYDLSTPMGRKRFRQDAVDATYEVDHMIERIEAAKLEAASEGRWLGGRRPFGFEVDGETPRPDEARAIDTGTTAILSQVSLNQVTRDWRATGVLTSGGKVPTPGQVRRILLRPRNAGLMVHRGRIVGRAGWLPVLLYGEFAVRHQEAEVEARAAIEEEWRTKAETVWRALEAVLGDPDRRTSPGPERRWLGSGLYLCGLDGCDLTMKVGTSSGRGRPTRPIYRCSGDARHLVRDAAALDEYVSEAIVARLQRPDLVDLLGVEPAEDTTGLRVELVTLRSRLDELGSAFADGAIDARQLREGSARLRGRVAELEERLAGTAQGSALDGLIGVPDVAERWAELGLDRRRAVLAALLEVTVLPAPKGRPPGWQPGRPYFNEEFVRLNWRHG